jgi:hypothetical protein
MAGRLKMIFMELSRLPGAAGVVILPIVRR